MLVRVDIDDVRIQLLLLANPLLGLRRAAANDLCDFTLKLLHVKLIIVGVLVLHFVNVRKLSHAFGSMVHCLAQTTLSARPGRLRLRSWRESLIVKESEDALLRH